MASNDTRYVVVLFSLWDSGIQTTFCWDWDAVIAFNALYHGKSCPNLPIVYILACHSSLPGNCFMTPSWRGFLSENSFILQISSEGKVTKFSNTSFFLYLVRRKNKWIPKSLWSTTIDWWKRVTWRSRASAEWEVLWGGGFFWLWPY